MPTIRTHARRSLTKPPRTRDTHLALWPSAATVVHALLTRCDLGFVARSLPSHPASVARRGPGRCSQRRQGCRSVACALTDSLHDAPPVHEAHWPTQLTHQVRRAPLTKPRRLALVTRASRLGRAQPRCGARTAHSLRPCLGGSRSRLAPFLPRSDADAADAEAKEEKSRSPAH